MDYECSDMRSYHPGAQHIKISLIPAK